MTTDGTATHTRKKSRSPSYPALALEVAIERCRVIFKEEGRNPAPIAAIQAHLGYKPNTGPANTTVAALKKFGLLDDDGAGESRRAKLTPLAIHILMDPEPAQWIREAALTPTIHKELWEQYEGQLPSDRTLTYELVANRNFTETGASEFVSQFRKTIAFADLTQANDFALDDSPEERFGAVQSAGMTSTADRTSARPSASAQPVQHSPTAVPPGMTAIPILLAGGQSQIQIVGQFPISEVAWQQFLAILNAMKPGLVLASPMSDDEID